jgi:spore coat protein CotH
MRAKTFVFVVMLALAAGGASIDSPAFRAADLFRETKVWKVAFTVDQSQWKVMAPKYATPRSKAPHNDSGVEFDWARAALSIDGRKFNDIAVRYKGNHTFRVGSGIGKVSLKIDLNKYVKGQKLAGLGKLNFNNNVDDPGWMNEVLAFRFFRDAGVPAPRTSYAKIDFSITGASQHQYWGLYSVVEDVDSNFTADRFKVKGGLLLKPVTSTLFRYLGDDWSHYADYDPKNEPTEAQKKRLIEFCRFVTSAPDQEFAARLGDYVDLDEFARFMAVVASLADLDSILDYGKNFYVWLSPITQRFSFIPWDEDHTFGIYPGRIQRTLSITHPWLNGNRFLDRVFAVPSFRASFMAKIAEYRKTILRPERIIAQVDEIAPAIRAAIEEESKDKAAHFDRLISDTVGGGTPATETLKAFIIARAKSVGDQLDGKAAGDLPGVAPFRLPVR